MKRVGGVGGKCDAIVFGGGKAKKRKKYKIKSLIWMADVVVELRDTTTNQKRAGVEKERMEKRDECGGVAAEGYQCAASECGGQERMM